MGKLLSPLLKIWWYCRNLILASAELWQATRSPTLTWNFHEKQDIRLMDLRWVMHHGSCSWRWDGSWVMDGSCSARWGGCKCWRSGFAKFLSFVATILLPCSQSDIGCEECYLSPSAGKKTSSSYLGMDFHHISYELATLCCLLRFLISLSLWYFDCQFQRIKHQIKFHARN